MLAFVALIARAEPLTLADALAEAFDANPELEVSKLGLARQQAELQVANGAWDPTWSSSVGVGASVTPSNTRVDETNALVYRSTTFTTALSQRLPTGATATASWFESTTSSNSANVLAPSTVADAVALSLTQPVLSGIGPGIGLKSARLAVDRATLALREAREALVVEVSAGYWRLVSARTSRDLAVRSREIAEQSAGDTEERYRQGFVGSGDVLQVQRAVGEARQAELVAGSEVEAADASLRRLLGRSVGPGATLDPADHPALPATLPQYGEVLALAHANNAGWLATELDAAGSALQVRGERLGALPQLDVTGSVGASGLGERAGVSRRAAASGDYVDWSVGTSLSVALPARVLRAGLTEARIDDSVARATLAAAEQDLALAVQAAVQRVETDDSRVSLAAETVRVAGLALASDQEAVREGRGSARDLVVSLGALDQAQAAQLSAQIDLQSSLLEVRRLAGTLLE